MKERAKLYKVKGQRVTHAISKRLTQGQARPEEAKQASTGQEKRVNLGGGKWREAQPNAKEGPVPMQL
jgi:hypothetical protein